LVSQETSGGDQWQDQGTRDETTPVATCDSPAFGYGGASWSVPGGAQRTFGPVNFKYASASSSPGPMAGALPSLRLRAPIRVSDGSIKLIVEAPGTTHVEIEISTDLVTWTPLATRPTTDGVVEYLDRGGNASGARFYRATARTE
jgi:hypothetical protein